MAIWYVVKIFFDTDEPGEDFKVFQRRSDAEARFRTAAVAQRSGKQVGKGRNLVVTEVQMHEAEAESIVAAKAAVQAGQGKLLDSEPRELTQEESDEIMAILEQITARNGSAT